MKRITKIEANRTLSAKKIRVAAYCRVSTSSAEQLISLDAQKTHYEEYIKSNDKWDFIKTRVYQVLKRNIVKACLN